MASLLTIESNDRLPMPLVRLVYASHAFRSAAQEISKLPSKQLALRRKPYRI